VKKRVDRSADDAVPKRTQVEMSDGDSSQSSSESAKYTSSEKEKTEEEIETHSERSSKQVRK
jgi:hypothetical protein